MKKLLLALGIVLMFVTLSFGDTINFGDSTIYWTGYASSDVTDNTRDTIGQPDFLGGSAILNGGKLSRINFDYVAGGNGLVIPEDLFLFTGTGNYVVRLSNVNSGGYGLYNFDPNGGYVLSDNLWNTPGYNIRDNHPVQAKVVSDQVDGVWFTGWDNTAGTHQASFIFNDLVVGDNFTLAWSVNCANDVLRENVEAVPTPEPATLLMMGFGSGILGFGMKRFRKKA